MHGANWGDTGGRWVRCRSIAVFRNVEVCIPYSECGTLTYSQGFFMPLYSGVLVCCWFFFFHLSILHVVPQEKDSSVVIFVLRSDGLQRLYLLRHCLTPGSEIRRRERRQETGVPRDLHLLCAAPAVGTSAVNSVKAEKTLISVGCQVSPRLDKS